MTVRTGASRRRPERTSLLLRRYGSVLVPLDRGLTNSFRLDKDTADHGPPDLRSLGTDPTVPRCHEKSTTIHRQGSRGNVFCLGPRDPSSVTCRPMFGVRPGQELSPLSIP